MNNEETRKYILSLKAGERVIETGKSSMFGAVGTVYISDIHDGSICVKWEWPADVAGMGTSVTGGTRRIKEVITGYSCYVARWGNVLGC